MSSSKICSDGIDFITLCRRSNRLLKRKTMKKINFCISLVLTLCLLNLGGCSKDAPPADYDASEVGKIKRVVPGVIVSMRPVRLHTKNAESVVNDTSDNESTLTRSHGYEYVIKLNSGHIISVVQSENIKLKNKQHILVIYGANTRVVADNGSDDL